MKLGTLINKSKDGDLVVVSRDNKKATKVENIAQLSRFEDKSEDLGNNLHK